MLSHEDITKLVEVSTAHGTGDVGLTCLEGCVLKLAHDPVRRMAIEIARHRLAEHEREVSAKSTPPTAPPFVVHEFETPTGTHTVAYPPPVADDDPIVPSPPLGRELGRSPIPTKVAPASVQDRMRYEWDRKPATHGDLRMLEERLKRALLAAAAALAGEVQQ